MQKTKTVVCPAFKYWARNRYLDSLDEPMTLYGAPCSPSVASVRKITIHFFLLGPLHRKFFFFLLTTPLPFFYLILSFFCFHQSYAGSLFLLSNSHSFGSTLLSIGNVYTGNAQ